MLENNDDLREETTVTTVSLAQAMAVGDVVDYIAGTDVDMNGMNVSRRYPAEKSKMVITGWMFLGTVLSYLVGSTILGLIDKNVGLNWCLEMVLLQLFICGPVIIFTLVKSGKGRRGEMFAATFRLHKVDVGSMFLTALMMLMMMPLLTFVNLLSQLLTKYVASTEIINQAGDASFVPFFISVAIIPAFSEEMLFRGFLYTQYRKRSILMGALLTGLMFGLLHGNLNQMAYALVMGFVFAMVDEAAGSTLPSMLMHLLVNGGSVIILYVSNKLTSSNPELAKQVDDALASSSQTTPGMLITFAFLSALGTYFAYMIYQTIAERCGNWDDICEKVKEPGKGKALRSMFVPPLIAALVVLVGLVIAFELSAYL